LFKRAGAGLHEYSDGDTKLKMDAFPTPYVEEQEVANVPTVCDVHIGGSGDSSSSSSSSDASSEMSTPEGAASDDSQATQED